MKTITTALIASAVGLSTLNSVASASRVVVSSLDNLPYDENGKLAKHLLVYSNGMCADLIENHFEDNPVGYYLRAVTGEAEAAYFGSEGGSLITSPPNKPEDCRAICVERGVDKSLVSAAMPYRHFEGGASFGDWFESSCHKVEACYINYVNRNAPLNMYWWVPTENRWRFHHSLEYGEPKTFCLDTYLGHVFKFEDSETKQVVKMHTIEYTASLAIGEAPENPTFKQTNYTKQIQDTLDSEWSRHSSVKRTFSELGFKKSRLPDDVFASMSAFYYNNRYNKVREEWGGKGLFVNWWEYDVMFIQIPWDLKVMWQTRLKELVEKWVGLELEQTSMYGLRRYEAGARLLTHVDRIPTHAASLIVNVAQGNVAEPWTVEVHDHGDRLHQVIMNPGDIVYYESARCLHGRNTPLKGEGAYYVNLFTHYRPVGDAEWFTKENHPGTPEPLIDVGNCWLEGSRDQVGQGAVKCDNPEVGPYLSPSMFTAHSGADLFKWWQDVGPENGPEAAGACLDEL